VILGSVGGNDGLEALQSYGYTILPLPGFVKDKKGLRFIEWMAIMRIAVLQNALIRACKIYHNKEKL
jgi:hypothetical protein